MCHPWLAAGVIGFVVVVIAGEVSLVARDQASASSRLDHGILGAELRRWFRDRVGGLAAAATDAGLSADQVTLGQLALSILCGLAYARGWLFTAGWILITSGTLDVLDGEIARRQRRDSPRGAFMDSVVDRYGESAVFCGLTVYYREHWLLWAVLAAWAGGFLVSYMRARAESLGVDCREGLLQRPERYVILGGASMLGTITAHLACTVDARSAIMATAIIGLAVLANLTAVQRAAIALRRLS